MIDEQGAFSQNYRAYGSAPREVRRHNDGALYGVMGGAHQLLYFDTNFIPCDHTLADPATRGNFSRSVTVDGRVGTLFGTPRVFGEIGGGTIDQDIIVFTRDGRGALEPAPLGPLLEAELARLRKGIADADAAHARALEQLEASMTPQAIAERRARREERFRKDRPRADAETMAREIDAAARSDEFDYQRQKERLAVPPTRDPRSACANFVPLMREMDWAAARRAIGWQRNRPSVGPRRPGPALNPAGSAGSRWSSARSRRAPPANRAPGRA